GASLRCPTQRRISTRVRREITKHAACTYRQVPWVPSRLGIAVARPFGTPPIPRGHVMVNSLPSSLTSQRRDGTELLHEVAQRRDAPVLGDLAVDAPHGADRVDTHAPR